MVVALAAITIAGGPFGAAEVRADPGAAAPPPALVESCPVQVSTVQGVAVEIKVHNAKPHHFIVPQQQAAATAYDQEAAALNAKKNAAMANLGSCAAATNRLSAGGKLMKPKPQTEDRLKRGQAALNGQAPPSYPAIKGNAKTKVWEPGRPLYEALRDTAPDQKQLGNIALQSKNWPEAESPDPAYPPEDGRTIGTNDDGTPKVEADHIVPLARLFYIPGFVKLPPRYMYQVAHSPMNLQWLSPKANRSKQAGEAAVVTGADPNWVQEQQELELRVVAQLTEIIKQILESLGIEI
ncbi:hypothetical protein nbrc107697_32320 [Gordonia crocea]|uniref:Uncharacterized protein n=2 Tax=Gordonia crocea TaxID=589162 RepID=A0A7I9V220_9ACTN|nr:hypothetical protein nbrc107697_32320 [Gordonia crocea]